MSHAPQSAILNLLLEQEDSMRHKGEQAGSVRKIGRAWHISFSEWQVDAAGNPIYRRVSRKVDGATSKRSAQRLGYEQWVGKANAPAACAKGVATLQDFVDGRFEHDHIVQLKKGGREHYHHILRVHLLPSLGGIELRHLTPALVQSLLSGKLAAGLSTQTVRHIRNVLSAILRHARALGYVESVATEMVRTPAVVAAERRALTWDQVRLLAEAVDPRYRNLIIVLAQTGMRIGEAAGLRWRSVNLTDDWCGGIAPNALLVCEAWTRSERTTLKTAGSRRIIPLTAESWVALALQHEASAFKGQDHPVFPGMAGRPMDAGNVAERFLKPALRDIGCGWTSWHCLRHTAATLADKAGLSLAEKQALLGHTTEAMSQRYTHPDLATVRGKLETITVN